MSATSTDLARFAKRDGLPSPDVRRALRRQAGWRQCDVAREVGVGRRTVTRWEAGRHTPSGETLRRYLAVLERMKEDAWR